MMKLTKANAFLITFVSRVVRLEISSGQFPEINYNLSGNLLITFGQSAVSKSSIAK